MIHINRTYLEHEHAADLIKSGLSEETISTAGITSIGHEQIAAELGFTFPGIRSMFNSNTSILLYLQLADPVFYRVEANIYCENFLQSVVSKVPHPKYETLSRYARKRAADASYHKYSSEVFETKNK